MTSVKEQEQFLKAAENVIKTSFPCLKAFSLTLIEIP